MATLRGRGPQVVLEGYARTVARGGAGRTMRDNIAAMDQLVIAGLVADGNAVDGSSRTGGTPYDTVIAQFPLETLPGYAVPAPLIDVSAALAGLGGPFLPQTGGNVSGPITLSAPAATLPGSAIQAMLDALPTNGGQIMLAPNTVYTVTALISTTKPNVRIVGSTWNTVLRRDPAYSAAAQLILNGANSVMEGFTIDGNGVTGTQFEAGVVGANSLVRNMQIINGNGTGHLNLSGQNSRASGNTITGLGISPSTQRGYGIWAISHATVLIDNNTITGTGIDGIGFDGQASRVVGNTVTGCHCWTGGQGGQIASYNATHGGAGNSSSVVGNTIGPAGSNQGSGIECWSPGMVVGGNSFDSILQAAITVFGNGTTITGNSIRSCGGNADAIVVVGNITDFVISGNRIADEQATPTMRYGIAIYAGTSDRYVVTGNQIAGNTSNAIFDGGTGTNKTIISNQGNGDSALPLTGGTITGNLTVNGIEQIGNGSATATLKLVGALGAGVVRGLEIQSVTAVPAGLRWQLGAVNSTSEPGANVGSDFGFLTYSDTGVFLASPLVITRATGLMTLAGGVSFGTVAAASTTDLSKHIAISGTNSGFNITTARLNYVCGPASNHWFVVGSTDVAQVNVNGITSLLQMQVGGTTGPTWTSGSAVPAATQPKGSLYTRTGGAVGSTLYVSQGAGTWNAVAGV